MDTLSSLKAQAGTVRETGLKTLLQDKQRNTACSITGTDLLFDFSHSLISEETFPLLNDLAQSAGLYEKVTDMFAGKPINQTENRAVLHTLLRATDSPLPDFQEVQTVKARLKAFSSSVRSTEIKGVTGKPLTNVLCIGIGGSYLGPEFVAEALKTHPGFAEAAQGRVLRFLANVDPVDFMRVTEGLDPEATLAIIISKTFTTAETMMNSRAVMKWLTTSITDHSSEAVVASHMCAVSTNLQKTSEFGIQDERVFGFWDWVGGRFSVTSAVGLLPLYLQFGEIVDQFLDGAAHMDSHFLEKANPDSFRENIPLMMGLIGFWNTECLGLAGRAVLPYSQALLRFAAHIQQLDMESNGKQCRLDGSPIENSGPIVFGEPGTNGQHSFYQLMHQGRVIPAEFIGFCKSHSTNKEAHNELMSNFFAQPDALAIGKSEEDLRAENCPDALIPHKVFNGNRPSLSLLFGEMNAFNFGQLLAIYEHRVAVEGFLWGINSFDQFGVELGKGLANKIKTVIQSKETDGHPSQQLLDYYLKNS